MDPELQNGSAFQQSLAHDAQDFQANAVKERVPTKAARRIRGEIACAECRRLKIRCDRTVPCSTCVKRGCGALCPNETIPPGEGSRFVLAATDHLQQKMSRLEARLHSLEDALAIVNGSESDRPHPLLSGGGEPEENTTRKASSEDKDRESSLPDAMGMLWMDNRGSSLFYGPSGGSESLLMSSDLSKAPTTSTPLGPVLQELDPSYLSPEVNQCYQAFPFTPPNVVALSVQNTIESFLPSMDRAITLCDTFLEHLSWMFHVVSRYKLVDELIPIIYKHNNVSYGPHDLALLLIVLGIGCLVDLDLPPYNLEAQHYYHLSRATLALQPVLGAQSMVTVKVLHLMSIYNGMSGKESNLEQSYVLLDLAGQVALRIGFRESRLVDPLIGRLFILLFAPSNTDIDPSMWKFEGREAYDRRVYFWNLMAGVLWQSLVTGRPPSLLMSYIDCRIPSAEDEDTFQEGEVPLGFGIWGFKASAECLIPLTRLLIGAKAPSYESILTMDRKIRDIVPPAKDSQTQGDRTAISMRTFVRSHYQDLMLLFLHRAHFAQAMMEHTDNPMLSPYSQSVKAAYSSACAVLQDTRTQFSKKPLLCARIWRIWSFTFSAAVIVGTLAIRGVHLNLNPSPLQEFDAICKVFVAAAETSNRAARALPVLQAMLEKAREAHAYYYAEGRPVPTKSDGVDELSYFGGRTNIKQQPPQSTSPESIQKTQPILQSQADYDTFSNARGPGLLGGPVPETFADLTGGWTGMFHEVPGPYFQRASSYGPAQVGFEPTGIMHDGPQEQQLQQSYGTVQGDADAVMLDDRWASFMNYSVLQEPSHYHRQPH